MGLFFKDDDEKKEVTKKDEKKPIVNNTAKKIPLSIMSINNKNNTTDDSDFSSQFNGTSSVAGVKKQEIVEYFEKIFEENNIPGPDYFEFRKALLKMKNVAQDDATKIKTVFIGFEAMGLTPQKLIETTGVYKKLFAGKLTQFNGELENAFKEQIGKKQTQVDELSKANIKIDEEMRKLNEQKIANQKTAENLNAEIQKNTSELSTSKNDFHATYDDLIKEIDGHVDLFTKHLLNQ